ncbi:MAG: DoxX family protein [Burkholderiales bacterium]
MDTVYELARTYGPLLGRMLIAFIFLHSAYDKAAHFSRSAAVMAAKGIPMARLLLVPAILVMLGGGLTILLGWHAPWGALALLLFMMVALAFYHPFWKVAPEQRPNELLHFTKNIALMGAMLFIIGMGPGPLSIDR